MPQDFITETDLALVGIAQETVDFAEAKTAGCVAAMVAAGNARAASALAEHCTLPLVAWGADLKLHIAAWVAFQLLAVVGFNPENPGDAAAVLRYRAAEAWFTDVAEGRITPSGLVDSTPDVEERGFVVVTRPSRGWVR